uniref:Ig-like domain-containing protein n=1 Tax=Oreochromis niloticus TaxID=8128 RepID=A0A669B3S2_ORENI
MMVLWITLLFLHQGYSLVPMKIVQLGEPVTLTCALPSNKELSTLEVHWYKQSIGDELKLISTLYGTTPPQYGQEIFKSRYDACNTKTFSNLTIWKTVQEDEGIYHCGIIEWHNPEWSGTYLLVKRNTQRASNYTVVQWPAVSDPVNPADTTALQCSVFSDSDNNTCAGDHDVFWFRAGSDKSHPSIIYTGRKRSNECEKPSDLQNRCVYRFSKNINSSDEGTYYCAVATCGEILFGNGTTQDVQGICTTSFYHYYYYYYHCYYFTFTVPSNISYFKPHLTHLFFPLLILFQKATWLELANTIIFLLCLVLLLIVIMVLIYMIWKNNSNHCKAAVLQNNFSYQKIQQNMNTWMFSGVVFTVMKADRCTKNNTKAEKRQHIYMAAKAFGLN